MSVRSTPSAGLARREPCAKCGMPVFLAERLNVGKSLYHRTCFTCARCDAQLSPGNCYETESEGQFCCETCPDEEKIGFFNENLDEEINKEESIKNKLALFEGKAGTYSTIPKNQLKLVESKDTLQRSLSDEEKSKSLNKHSESSDGASFYTAFADTNPSLNVSSSSKAMSSFISQLTTSDEPPSLPASEPPDSFRRYNVTPEICLNKNSKYFIETSRSLESEPYEEEAVPVDSDLTSFAIKPIDEPVVNEIEKEDDLTNIQMKPTAEEVPIVKDLSSSKSVNNKQLDLVALHSTTKLSEVKNNQQKSASAPVSDAKIKTKDNEDEDKNCKISIVKSRMKIFETSTNQGSQNIEQINNTQPPKVAKIMTTQEVPYSNTVDVLIPLNVESSIEETHHNKPEEISSEPKSVDLSNTEIALHSKENEDIVAKPVEEHPEETEKPTLPSEVDSIFTKESHDKDKESQESDLVNPTEEIADEIPLLPTVINKDSKSRTPSTEDLIKKIDFDATCDIEDPSVDDSELPTANISDKTIPQSLSPLKTDVVVAKSSSTEKIDSQNSNDNLKSSPIVLDESILRDLSKDDVTCVTINSSILADSTKNDTIEYPHDLNPFGDEDERVEPQAPKRMQKLKSVVVSDQPKESTNPFGSDEDTDEVEHEGDENIKPKPPRPPPPQIAGSTNTIRRLIPAPKISLNPFWSDDEEPSEDDDKSISKADKPAPAPRTVKSSALPPEPAPRALQSNSYYGSTTSLMSDSSGTSGAPITPYRKKKPAPKPPGPSAAAARGAEEAVNISGNSLNVSPRATPRPRKARPAPAPPSSLSSNDHEMYASASSLTPSDNTKVRYSSTPSHANTITDSSDLKNLSPILIDVAATGCGEWEKRKNNKDENNRTRQSQTSSTLGLSPTAEITDNILAPNKSSNGRWKRKKGPAPLAVPPRRKIPLLALTDIKHELEVIEVQQQGLEKQGVKLEQMIREKCEGPNMTEDDPMPIEVDDLVLQLFELVNEKNELFRRQAELMYLRRQQRLEEEHAELEYQIRCLMAQPERNKTDSDKAREEMLISRLVEVVQRRNEVVECLEMDRLREAEEDHSISSRLELYAGFGGFVFDKLKDLTLHQNEKKNM